MTPGTPLNMVTLPCLRASGSPMTTPTGNVTTIKGRHPAHAAGITGCTLPRLQGTNIGNAERRTGCGQSQETSSRKPQITLPRNMDADFFQSFIIGLWSSSFPQRPRKRHRAIERPPRSRWTASTRAMVLRPRGAPLRLTQNGSKGVAFGLTDGLGTPVSYHLVALWPGPRLPLPNASPAASRRPTHGSRRKWWLTSLPARTFTRQHSTS